MRRLIFSLCLLIAVIGIGIGQNALTAQTNDFERLVFDARADLEVLADAVLSPGIRPQQTWTGNTVLASPTVVLDLWYDNEQLASAIFGPSTRPFNWIGAPTTDLQALARAVRHDLELSADAFYGASRPNEWRGAAPILRCSRTLQNVLVLLNQFFDIRATTPESAFNYCLALQAEVEDDLINIVFETLGTSGRAINPFDLLSSIRGDLERLADELYGLRTRPEGGYRGGRDINAPNFITDARFDLELIANDRLAGARPLGWNGTLTTAPTTAYFNLRYDLELLTDATLGIGVRPSGWQGVVALERCDPLVLSLATVIERVYRVTIEDIPTDAFDYCAQVRDRVNAAVENPPVFADTLEGERFFTGEARFAFSYLDFAATQYMGIMPGGTSFRALYRNFGESNMMFVQGFNFALWVDVRFTTLAETAFRTLPAINNVSPVSFCDAFWCNGPGPTPTPTGSGPLLSILVQTTPIAIPDAGSLAQTKQLIPWNFIRVTYVLDNLDARTAQVTLELCEASAPTATNCEPALSVFDGNTNTNRPAISTFNGLNVFELRYGYQSGVIIESAGRYAQDVWVSDPTIR